MSKKILTGVFLLIFVFSNGFAQNQNPSSTPAVQATYVLSEEDIAAYKKQAAQMVSFMEFAFNTLGSSKSEYKDKDIIINQSFLKFFKDPKVQIEDDLVEQRDVVTNKDVQAYLKDIDFFYSEVVFKFTIEEITQEVNEKGEVFFKVKTSRNLKGITLEGKEVNDNKPRFIEINLDESMRELKIASIYTTRSGEEEELISWWNNLDPEWRNYFAAGTMISDSLPLKEISGISKDSILLIPEGVSEFDSTFVAKTVKLNTSGVFSEIRRLLRTERIDISGNKKIYDLEPLSVMRSLKYLNISGSGVSALEPVRNLSKLETLTAASSQVVSLQALQYSSSLLHLDIASTFVTDLSPVANFSKLESLDVSGLQVEDVSAITNLDNLRELRLNRSPVRSVDGIESLANLELLELSGSMIADLTPVGKLGGLHRLNINKTNISDLGPLSALTALEYIYLDNTPVSDISPLKSLPELKAVYCDKSLVDREDALSFLTARPEVKVIYESEELTAWWKSLPDEWKAIFETLVTLDTVPTREQLHELTNVKKLNIFANSRITDLNPLRKISALEELNAAKTSITEIVAVKEMINLKILDINSCPVSDLSPVSALKGLATLNISSTKIIDLSAVKGLRNLQNLHVSNCPITQVSPLFGLGRLEVLYAEGVPVIASSIMPLWDSIPEALIVYQTVKLREWWKGLSEPWKVVFNVIEPIGVEPTPEQLHRIAALRKLDLSESRGISDLNPVRTLVRLENLNISRLPVPDLSPLLSLTRLFEFNCSNTPVDDLSDLAGNRRLLNLNLSNTQINDIDVVEGFPDLKMLDISGTQVTRLNAVSGCSKLEQLDCYNTRISSLKAIQIMPSLKLLRIYNTRVSQKNIDKFKEANPGVEVVFY
ncbi:MAG: leucine-rich repeat domain-containing protein [Lentimicrobium sp.]